VFTEIIAPIWSVHENHCANLGCALKSLRQSGVFTEIIAPIYGVHRNHCKFSIYASILKIIFTVGFSNYAHKTLQLEAIGQKNFTAQFFIILK